MQHAPSTQSREAGAAYSYRSDPAVPSFPDDKPIIVYDGYCGLCTGWVRYVLRHDLHARFRFLSAQSDIGHALYVHYGLDPKDYETNILIEQGVAYYKSEASIRMAEGLGFPSSLASVFRVLPLALRDRLYDVIARNRLRIFGKHESCYAAPSSDSNRFIA